MTRAFLPMRHIRDAVDSLNDVLPNALTESAEYKTMLNTLRSDALGVACRLLRFFHSPLLDFANLLRTELKVHYPFDCVVIRGKGTDVIVLPNLKLDPRKISSGWLEYFNTLKIAATTLDLRSLVPEIYNMIGEQPRKFSPLSRAVSAFGRRERMSFSTALARYSITRPTDKKILTLGEAYTQAVKGFELLFCESTNDYLEMYETSGIHSCMVTTSDHSRPWRFMLTDNKINPAAFYFYHPFVKGCFVKRDGKIVARTLVYDIPGSGKFYGRIYSSNTDIYKKLVLSLQNNGYTNPIVASSDLRGSRAMPCEFYIPGYELKGQPGTYFMPLPYLDNIAGPLEIQWNNDTKQFKVMFGPSKSVKQNCSVQTTEGFVTSLIGSVLSCRACGGRVEPRKAIRAIDGTVFCSEGCVKETRYARQFRSDGVIVYAPLNDDMFITNDGINYTNLNAAHSCGAIRLAADYLSSPEEQDLYSHNYPRDKFLHVGHFKEPMPIFIGKDKIPHSSLRLPLPKSTAKISKIKHVKLNVTQGVPTLLKELDVVVFPQNKRPPIFKGVIVPWHQHCELGKYIRINPGQRLTRTVYPNMTLEI